MAGRQKALRGPVMQLLRHQSLRSFNTFGVEATAEYFTCVRTDAELIEALQSNIQPIFILGSGSNILLTGDIDGLVIKNELAGKQVVETTDDHALVCAGGGENWHSLVMWALENGLGGIENLSLIPGTAGAAPIQNIGAYGVELKEVFVKLEAIDLKTQEILVFSKEDCHFGYRDSIFKKTHKDRYCITKVFLRLTRNHHHLRIDYGDIRRTLDEMNITAPGIRDISEAVIRIRSSKLPDPVRLGNAGSFFKNPEIDQQHFQTLQARYADIPGFPLPHGQVKIPAAWLIERCGWKGKRIGQTGSHAQQALVLVNYGGASGMEIWSLAMAIRESVQQQFGILLNAEVNRIGE